MCCPADINTARCYGIRVNVYRFPLRAVRLAAAILTFRQPHRFFSSPPPPPPAPVPSPLSVGGSCISCLCSLLNWVYLPFFFFERHCCFWDTRGLQEPYSDYNQFAFIAILDDRYDLLDILDLESPPFYNRSMFT